MTCQQAQQLTTRFLVRDPSSPDSFTNDNQLRIREQ